LGGAFGATARSCCAAANWGVPQPKIALPSFTVRNPAGSVCSTASGRREPFWRRQVKFEYRVFDSHLFDRQRRELEEELNQRGHDGWELVATWGMHNQTYRL